MKWYYDINRIVKNFVFYIAGIIIFLILILAIIKIHITIEAKGIIEPSDSVYIKSKISGKVKAIYCKNGEYVQPGTVLMELDDEEALCKLNTSKIELKTAEINLKISQLELHKKNEEYNLTTSIYLDRSKSSKRGNKPYEIIQAETEVSNAVLNLEKAKETYRLAMIEYSNTKIITKVSGIVYRYDVEDLVNREIKADRILFVVGNTNEWQANLWVEEKYIADLTVGQEASIDVRAYQGIRFKTLKGRVIGIAGAIKRFDMGNFLNVKVKIIDCRLDKDNKYKLMPGMFVKSEITSIKRSVLALLWEEL